MTTPDAVADILNRDDRLTDDERAALAELFAAAYEAIVDKDREHD